MKIIVLADDKSANISNSKQPLLTECLDMLSKYSGEDNVKVQVPLSVYDQIKKTKFNQQILTEPIAKGTAPALGLAVTRIFAQNPEEIVTVAYADHPVSYQHKLLSTLKVTHKVAQNSDKLILIGVNPTSPATHYGYAKIGRAIEQTGGKVLFEMIGFKEKPDKATAQEFISSWQYLWNTGYMTAKAKTILDIYEKHLPKIHQGLLMIKEALGTELEDKIIKTVFETFPKISIDTGIYEKIDKEDIAIIPVDLNITHL